MTLAKKRLAGRRDGELALARHEKAPQTWDGLPAAELMTAGASDDKGLAAAAERLMRLIDEADLRPGKYAVQVQGSQGVQIGAHNTQHNVFGSPQGH